MAREVPVALDFRANQFGDLIVEEIVYDLGRAPAYAFDGSDGEYHNIIVDLWDQSQTSEGLLHLFARDAGLITRQNKVRGRWLSGEEAAALKASWPAGQQPSGLDESNNGSFTRGGVSTLIRIR